MANSWRDVTDCFSESQRHYRGTYMEMDEVYNESVEVSLFSAPDEKYEIYISYGRMYGTIYVKKENAYELREEVKRVLEREYKISKEPTDEFIDEFVEKYNLELDL